MSSVVVESIRMTRFSQELRESIVRWNRMRNITLSAGEDLIEQARQVARSQHKTLNAAFREWLQQYTAQAGTAHGLHSLMKGLRHVRPGRHLSRDEMNER